MAVENVSYKRCTCDICGKQRDINQALILPNDWTTLKIGANEMDCCDECRDLIEDIIDSIRNEKRNTV